MMRDIVPKAKIVFLANAKNIHTKRWACHLCLKYDITILTFEFALIPGVTVIQLKSSQDWLARYILVVPQVRKIIRSISPLLVHVHYAGGYGLTASLCGFHPTIVSVWGSDIYISPNKSFVHRAMLKFILNRADVICSTSKAMALRCKAFTRKRIVITPFGVDCEEYVNSAKSEQEGGVTVGTIKKLDVLYGVDRLIHAFAILAANDRYAAVKLILVGDGVERENLRLLAESLGVAHRVHFVGAVPQSDVPAWLNKLSVYVALSRSESFGVAVLEASACGIPVVVSDAGGLPEVVVDKVTGFIIKNGDPTVASRFIARLLDDSALRECMGAAGRRLVTSRYNLRTTPRPIDAIYAMITARLIRRETSN